MADLTTRARYLGVDREGYFFSLTATGLGILVKREVAKDQAQLRTQAGNGRGDMDGDPDAGGRPAPSPVPGAIATMELLRGTPAAAWDFDGVIARLPRVVTGVAFNNPSIARQASTVSFTMVYDTLMSEVP